MTKKTFVMVHDIARQNAARFAQTAPHGWVCTYTEPKKTRIQEEKYHAMIGDISRQVQHIGRFWDADDMKRILVDEFAHEMRMAGTPLHHDSRVTVSFDGLRTVQLGIQTRDFYVKEAAQFIEYLFAFGAERNVIWTEADKIPEWADCRETA